TSGYAHRGDRGPVVRGPRSGRSSGGGAAVVVVGRRAASRRLHEISRSGGAAPGRAGRRWARPRSVYIYAGAGRRSTKGGELGGSRVEREIRGSRAGVARARPAWRRDLTRPCAELRGINAPLSAVTAARSAGGGIGR